MAQNDIDEQQTREQLEAVKQQIQALQKRLKANRGKYGKATQALKKTEQRINNAAKILNATQSQIKREQSKLKKLALKEQRLKENKQKHQQILAHQLRSAYSAGKQEYLKLLLSQQQPDKLGRILVYYDYLNEARTDSIKQLQVTLNELVQVQQSIETQLSQLAVLEAAQKQEQSRLLKLKGERKKNVDKLALSIASQDQKIQTLREDEEELESLLHQVRKALEKVLKQQNLQGLAEVKGRLVTPVNGRLQIAYGATLGRGIKSNGVRLAAPEGRKVAAIYHGRVVFADWLKGFGLLLIVDHGAGYMSLYGNNQSLFKEVGDWVEAGEQVATVGVSGGKTSAGLYFEIRYQGQAQNPLKWIRL